MDLVALAVAVVSGVLALAALWRASVANQRVLAVERRVALALDKDEPEVERAQALPEPKPTAPPKPVAKAETEPKPAPRPKVKPEPGSEPIDPLVRERLTKMLRQARDMARHVGLDRQVTVRGERGFRVPVDIEDDLDRQALEHLKTQGGADVLEIIEEPKGAFLVIKP